jgi:hypothetical protein
VRIVEDAVLPFGALTLTHVAAQHGLTPETNSDPASGIVLMVAREPTPYLAGDTVWYAGMKANLERFRPTVTELNRCEATLSSRRRIMDEEDVLAACQAAPWTRMVTIPMKTVSHGNVLSSYPRRFVDRLGVGKQVLISVDGEVLTFWDGLVCQFLRPLDTCQFLRPLDTLDTSEVINKGLGEVGHHAVGRIAHLLRRGMERVRHVSGPEQREVVV